MPTDYYNGSPVYEIVIMGETLSDILDCEDTNTCGMMMPGQTPQFYIVKNGQEIKANYVASDGTSLQNIPAYYGLDQNYGLTLDVITDCNNDTGGTAVNSGICGDCWGGFTGNSQDYMDTDSDGICNAGSISGDDDNCPDTPNTDQLNNDGDLEGDACDNDDDNDSCLDDVDDAPFEFDDNYDGDENADDCDDDDDNDGVLDADDAEDNNEFVCSDIDSDGCDECSSGIYTGPNNDGSDYDSDGICN